MASKCSPKVKASDYSSRSIMDNLLYTLHSHLLLHCFDTGIRITGNAMPLTLGGSARLICSSDFDIIVAEWLFDGRVIVQSLASQATLYIPLVNDSLHNRQYLCRITAPYGAVILQRYCLLCKLSLTKGM